MENDRNFNDYTGVIAVMIVILIIGIIVDEAIFGNRDQVDPPPLRPDRRGGGA